MKIKICLETGKSNSETCWMGMLNGYVKVVDDIKSISLEDIKEEAGKYKPTSGAGGGGCCG